VVLVEMLDELVEFHAFEGELLELVRQVSRQRADPPMLLALEECDHLSVPYPDY
jgi:hypothetical protein